MPLGQEYNMDCKEAKNRVNGYIEGTLTDKECSEFIEHVRSCPDCYEELETYFIIGYALDYLDSKDGMERSFDMNKLLEDDLRRCERRISGSKLMKNLTRVCVTISEVSLAIGFAVTAIPGAEEFIINLLKLFKSN